MKCTRCGKGSLFQKTNSSGLCKKCELADLQATFCATQKEILTAKKEIEAVKAQRMDEQSLLAQAVAKAETAAKSQLESLFSQIQEQTTELSSCTAQTEAEQKKATQIQNRIAKLKPLVESIKYAISVFPEAYSHVKPTALLQKMDTLLPPVQDLNCLTIKDLRTQYRQLEKQIRDVGEQYQSRYSTKANASIYQLMLLALNAELQLIMNKLSFSKLDDAIASVKRLTERYYTIITEGNQSIAPTLTKFTGQIESLYIDAVKLEYEYFVRRERAKEEQRALREQMQQEAAERKLLEQQKKKVEAEESKYQTEIERIRLQIQSAAADQLEALTNQLEAIKSQLADVEGKKEEIIRLQNGKAGTVYVISNLGSFGDEVFKVGMTRRLEPQDRITELSNASVPFPFDVHSFIFSQDAVSLEYQLHQQLNSKRVNKVNLRKEFFQVSLDDLEQLVTEIDPTAPFNRTMLAEQYNQSLSLDNPIEVSEMESDDDETEDE